MGQKSRFFAAAMITLSTMPISSFAVDSWQAGSAYPQGSETCYNEILYKARWWATPGEEPGSFSMGRLGCRCCFKNLRTKCCKKARGFIKVFTHNFRTK
ncbi:hypothetical protein KQ246_19060 (plasmid) [Pseudoalteromonas shioyasakiensis]|nr:hypothetical protein KQ246_19060 [Pseudoalteromonas shioyasakiensis]